MQVSQEELEKICSYLCKEGADGVLQRLRMLSYQKEHPISLTELLEKKIQETTEHPLAIDLEGLDGEMEDVQWIFRTLDEWYAYITSALKLYILMICLTLHLTSRRTIRSGILLTSLTERDVDMHLSKHFFDILTTEIHLHL